MNILKNVPGSVLWLLDDNEAATANLKRSAAALGVDPARLVFAPRCGRAEHLARLPLADLYFDTMPSSSAAAVSDALAAGVPVLTCAGETMVSRISGSLLHACGLSDMITYAHEHYDHAARLVTRDPKSLKQLRARLVSAQKTASLFDAESYQCGLDAAFEHMTAIARNGEWPYAFAVALGKEERQKKRKAVPVTPVEEDEPLLLAEADAC
jgi:predicted O-linked N-acetylglucosamine transferase (SPINDLY family)